MKTRKKNSEAPFNDLYSSYRTRANKNGMGFDLTKDQFRGLITLNCTYCGREPFQTHRHRHGKGEGNWSFIKYMGVDRKDSNKGYIQDNVVPCCVNCNYGKHDMSMHEWIAYLDTLVQYRSSQDCMQ